MQLLFSEISPPFPASFLLSLPLLVSEIAPQFSVSFSLSLSRCSSVKLRLLSVLLSCSLSRCSSVKLRLLSLFLRCSLSRCSSEQFRLLSLALCRSLSRWAWLACRLLSRFLCLSLYSKLEDIINKISRIAELHGAQPIRKIAFSSELTSLNFSVVYAPRNAGGPLFSRQKLCTHRARSIQRKFSEISVPNSMDRFGPTGKVSKKRVHHFSRSDRLEFWLNGSCPQTTWNFALAFLWWGRTVGRSVGRSRDYQIFWDG